MVKNWQLAIRNTYVAPAFVQVDGKDFGNVVADKLTTYGDQWKGINLADVKMVFTRSKIKRKHNLKKPKLNFKKMVVFNSHHIDKW